MALQPYPRLPELRDIYLDVIVIERIKPAGLPEDKTHDRYYPDGRWGTLKHRRKDDLLRGVLVMKQIFKQAALAALLATGLGLAAEDALAVNCVYGCGSDEIQYAPGQPLKLEIINNTQMYINLERILDFDPYAMRPGQTVELNTVVGTGADLSVVFWEQDYRPVNVRLHRPEVGILEIEFLPSGSFGDRAVHVVNDGRVLIY